jgi:hypothetical protein
MDQPIQIDVINGGKPFQDFAGGLLAPPFEVVIVGTGYANAFGKGGFGQAGLFKDEFVPFCFVFH